MLKSMGPFILITMCHMHFYLSVSTTARTLAAVCVCFAFLSVFCSGNSNNRTIKSHELRGDQWRSMNEIHEHFRRNVFYDCLSQSHLSMNCSGCEYIYIDAIIDIDKKGRLCGYTKIKENVCGQKAPEKLERCFIDYLKSIIFPKNLRNMSIEMRLGTGLKC